MAKSKQQNKDNPNLMQLWPTSVLVKRFAHFQKVNPALLALFYDHKQRDQKSSGATYASHDRLLAEYPDNPALKDLAEFIKGSVFELAGEANSHVWRQHDQFDLNMTGIWFQISNDNNFHELHTHGNCSWSGVYYVQSGQSDPDAEACRGRQPNGVTRFYGPNIDISGGGHADAGNLYLQDYVFDSYPQDGKLVVFPAHLKHMVFPYRGEDDRVVVSFHVQISNAKGDHWGYGFR